MKFSSLPSQQSVPLRVQCCHKPQLQWHQLAWHRLFSDARVVRLQDGSCTSQAFVQSVREWDSPPRSVGAMAAIVLGCYYPHILATAMLASLVLYGLRRHSPDAGARLFSCCQTAR